MNCDEEVIFNEELKKLYLEFKRCQDPYVKFRIIEDIDIVIRAIALIRNQSQQ